MTAEIVRLPGGNSLTDIPAMMRQVADEIESGAHGEVDAAFLLIPRKNAYPTLFGWGDVCGKNEPIIQLELAKTFLLTRVTSR